MTITTTNRLSASQATQFFLGPEAILQRQYEALRAYYVEGLTAQQVAQRFGYSPGAFRALCHQFRHDPAKRDCFFHIPRPGPRTAPARDRLRQLVIALRKKNLSVYDIQRELLTAGHTLSINSLSLLLREEGFARLPRRGDDERPPTTRPIPAAAADVRTLSLSPRTFPTRLGGLFFFIPLMRDL